jgi:hypothetical protein
MKGISPQLSAPAVSTAVAGGTSGPRDPVTLAGAQHVPPDQHIGGNETMTRSSSGHVPASGGRWTAVLLAAVLLAVEAVIVAESWRGLTGFAYLTGISGVAAWGVPVTLDGVSLVAALVALRAELAGETSGLYRAVLFAFTAASAAANYWHGHVTGGEQAAVYMGGMSVAVAVVFSLALRQIRHEDRRRAGTVTGRLPRFSVAHWARYPALTWRAWSLAVRDGHTSPRAALDAALELPRRSRAGAAGRGSDGAVTPAGDAPGLPASGAPADGRVAGHVAPVGASRGRPSRQLHGASQQGHRRRSQADTEAAALAVLSGQASISGADLGRAIGMSPRTGQRLLAALGNRSSGTTEAGA